MNDEKKPEVDTLVLGQPTQPSRRDITALVELLEKCGHSREEAQTLAAETIRKQVEIDSGVTFGHIHAEQLGMIWQQATKHGKRKLVLEIAADALSHDEWDGHIRVEVKDAQTWKQYAQEQAEAREREVN